MALLAAPAAGQVGEGGTVLELAGDPLPLRTANVERVAGSVLVRLPGAARFVAIDELTTIPLGSTLDARNGVVRLTAAADTLGGTQTGELAGGAFRVTQRLRRQSATELVTELALHDGDFVACASAGRARNHVVRHLQASARGRFVVVGRYAASINRGARWKTTDTCDDTEVHVQEGAVLAVDHARQLTFVVRAGDTYYAQPH